MDDRYIERNDEVEIDLQRLILAVMQRARQVLLTAVLCGMIALLGAAIFMKPQYRAAVMFYVNNSSFSAEDSTHSITSADIAASKSLVDSYLVILNTEATLTEVIAYVEADHTVSEVRSMIEAEAVNGTEIFQVIVTAEDLQEAESIAEAIGYVLPNRISDIMEGTSAKVVDTVVAASEPAYPAYVKNTVLGLLFGVLLSAAFIVLRELFDSTIKCQEDIAKTTQYSILAAIPDTDVSAASEAYKLLRTKLVHAAVRGRDCRVIGVSAALVGEGATTTAIHLAHELGQLGQRVVLVDCDLRRSALAETLHVSEYSGLADYLTCRIGAEDLLQSCTLFGEETAFTVISAGQAVPNPTELLSSPRMEQLLTVLRNIYDYVILDLPPVSEVSDALIVAKEADGILLVVRNEYCDRHALGDAVAQFEFMDAEILGIVYHCGSESFFEKNRKHAYEKSDLCHR